MNKAKRNDPCPCGSGKKYKKCCQPSDVTQSSQAVSNATSIKTLLATAVSHHQSGRLQEAEAIYQEILAIKPNHADALHLLGLIAYRAGNNEAANELISKAITVKATAAMYFNLALVFDALSDIAKAKQCYLNAIELDKKYAEAFNNLGNILAAQGKLLSAIDSYEKAIKINPGYAEAHNNLGNAYQSFAQLDKARYCYEQSISCAPGSAEAHNNLGFVLQQQGDYEAAEACYHKAMALNPALINIHQNLASLYILQRKIVNAMDVCLASLQLANTDITRAITVQCLQYLSPSEYNNNFRSLLLQAISEVWCLPRELVSPAINYIRSNADISAAITRVSSAWPIRLSMYEVFSDIDSNIVYNDPLLLCLLIHAQVTDVGLERLLGCIRNDFLDNTAADRMVYDDEERLVFYSALARNCFINEYVFTITPEEYEKATKLKAQLSGLIGDSEPIPAALILSVASYFPLYSVPQAVSLLQQQWPEPVASVLVQQIQEPKEEQDYKEAITALTSIDDKVSLQVQEQYEQNPYPRWVKTSLINNSVSIDEYLRHNFPLSAINNPNRSESVDILIAGCGTGQQSIQTATRYLGAQVLAIDLSSASLAYAIRKTREYKLSNIEYAQADITQLASIERQFHLIESVGVLHHLDDPLSGLQQLVSLLRPGGFMYLGFYSEVARKEVVLARNYIAEKSYNSTVEDIRRCREDIMSVDTGNDLYRLTSFGDFFGISECRDLLFHAQEHRFTIPQLQSILADFKLDFIGFLLRPHIVEQYKQRFPHDVSLNNLENWHVFELDNPETFAGMYQFYVQSHG
jgi:tetratricopeptide (TPR) repeat protein/2-polyprenyl-3-methyl-5-hydroxy-6-metoxy-1,4-benzoquinol methylase